MEPMAKIYASCDVEDRIYRLWEENEAFRPEVNPEGEPYCIIMPPPNITGKLHMGHAIFVAIQDLFARYYRMRGRAVLWLPGTDHASIATQNVVEKEIKKEGLTRHDLGREAFLERVWTWVNEYGQIINNQIRKLGASCDWSRSRFTMDERANQAVNRAFVELYKQKLIYKGKYLVNWCPRCQTVLADDEVDHRDEDSKLYYVRYPVSHPQSSDMFLTIATVRPETILGDVAVAVHPDDPRYKKMVGKKVRLPFTGRDIPVIADKRVDMEFGTGALKITPAHDFTDYEIGQTHSLPLINILREDGTIKPGLGAFDGLEVTGARKQAVKQLQAEGVLEKTADYAHSIGVCYRCSTVIEPFISTQWFVNVKPLAKKTIQVMKEERIEFIPDRFTKVFTHWINNLHDWCISRQLWWGHQIPAWYCEDCLDKLKASKPELDGDDAPLYTVVAEKEPQSCPRCGGSHLTRDPDTLDTWFSSGLWPFSTLGWPEETDDLRKFFPTHLMETGYDIIFFWIARMVLLSEGLMNDIPFRTVYLHGLVRDAQGNKMSKSRGNVVDPLDMVQIYGADALGLSFLLNLTPGNDMKFSEEKTTGYRNFCNKLWNAARFIMSSRDEAFYRELVSVEVKPSALSLPDRWIKSRLHEVVKETTTLLEVHNFGEAGSKLYDFVWNDFCDWYLEMSKLNLDSSEITTRAAAFQTMVSVWRSILSLLHPYIPFITEELWGQQNRMMGSLGEKDPAHPLLVNAPWPKPAPFDCDKDVEQNMDHLRSAIQKIRNLRIESGLTARAKADVVFTLPVRSKQIAFFEAMEPSFRRLAGLNTFSIGSTISSQEGMVEFIEGRLHVTVKFTEEIDRAKELMRLQSELGQISAGIQRLDQLLGSESFVRKAPEAIVAKEKAKRESLLQQKELIEKQINSISSDTV